MRILLTVVIGACLFFCYQSVRAQDGDYSVKKLTEHIYELSYDAGGYPVKVIASVGDDGILLVDTGERQMAEALKAKLEELRHGTPKIIIITHEHIEHLEGTEIFGKAPLVIGHPSLRKVLKHGHFLFSEYGEATFPDIEFGDSLSLYFNGEQIKLLSVAGGHSGSDIVVWFTGSGVACVQALCNWPHFPSIDWTTGDVNRYPDAVKRVIDWLPSDTKIIPGHGEDCSMAEFMQFYDMLIQTRDVVKSELARGKTLETLQKEDVLKNFKNYDGSYTSTDSWIKDLVKGLQGNFRDTLKSVYEAMYYTLKEQGVDSAIAYYATLKRDHAAEYDFGETTPAIIGYLLFHKDRYPEAIEFFKLSLKEYPKGKYANLSYELLGNSYEKTNDFKQAIKCYKELLTATPEDTAIANRIKALETK